MSRAYLQSHSVHETLQDCVRDLVTERPEATLDVLATLQRRIAANSAKDHSSYYVVLGATAADRAAIAQHLPDIAAGRGASVADCAALSAAAAAAASGTYSYSAHAAKPLLPAASSALVVNVETIADALRLQATSGPCKGCAVVCADEAALASREYLMSVNPVAQYYAVKAIGGMSVVGGVTDINSALA